MSEITVEIDGGSGFCFGVVNAIRKAEAELGKQHPLYCLGDIVHNSDEVERLRRLGLVTITHEELENLHDVTVLLRAHGEPPKTYETARRNNIHIIDATCPVVLQLQKRIKKAWEESESSTQIVIYGKHGHAEVNGLVGQTDGEAIVVETTEELNKIDTGRDVVLFSQTTKPLRGMQAMISDLQAMMKPQASFHWYDTVCRQVANRADNLRKFASAHDVVLFVSGAKSSNGRALFNECRAVNSATHLISNAGQVEPAWLRNARSIGICGATSTPRWLMELVRDKVQELISTGN